MTDTSRVPVDTAKIKKLRQKLGKTMEQAANDAGLVGRQHWYEIESGKTADVRVSTLERVARALGVKARELLK